MRPVGPRHLKSRGGSEWLEMDFVGSHLKKHLLITGRTKLIRMIQLLAQWKDLLLYLSNDHFVLPNGKELQKVDVGEWGVHLWKSAAAETLFLDKARVPQKE